MGVLVWPAVMGVTLELGKEGFGLVMPPPPVAFGFYLISD